MLLVGCALAGCAGAETSLRQPDWLPAADAPEPTVVWEASFAGELDTPHNVIVDDVLLTLDVETGTGEAVDPATLRARELATGDELWSIDDFEEIHAGTDTVAVEETSSKVTLRDLHTGDISKTMDLSDAGWELASGNSLLYTETIDGDSDGPVELHNIDMGTGEELWKQTLNDRTRKSQIFTPQRPDGVMRQDLSAWDYRLHPPQEESIVLATDSEGLDGATAYDFETGEPIWESPIPFDPSGPATASPAQVTGGGDIYTQVTSQDCTTTSYVIDIGTGDYRTFDSHDPHPEPTDCVKPRIWEDQLVSTDAEGYPSLNLLADWSTVWRGSAPAYPMGFGASTVIERVSYDDGSTTAYGLGAVDSDTGATRWVHEVEAEAVDECELYFVGDTLLNTCTGIPPSTATHTVQAIDLKTGETVWGFDNARPVTFNDEYVVMAIDVPRERDFSIKVVSTTNPLGSN